MVDLGCGHGDLRLDYGDEIPLDHVDLHKRVISIGSDSNISSCFEMASIRYDSYKSNEIQCKEYENDFDWTFD